MSEYTSSNHAFRPVKCYERDIKTMSPEPGYVLFTQDTKKIYSCVNGEYIAMGGSTNILYGHREFSDLETNTDQTIFTFTIQDLESEELPNVDDLILNIEDGGFYRVTELLDDTLFSAERIAVSGTGGGGGGGTGGDSSTQPVINLVTPSKQYYLFNSPDTWKLQFKVRTLVAGEGNYVDTIKLSYGNATEEIKVNVPFDQGEGTLTDVIEVDLYKLYHNPFNYITDSMQQLSIEIIDAYGLYSKWTTFSFYLLDISLTTMANSLTLLTSEDSSMYRVSYNPKGGSALKNKKITATIANVNSPEQVLLSEEFAVTNLSDATSITLDFSQIQGLEHGVYLVNAVYSVYEENAEETYVTDAVQTKVIYFDESVGYPLVATDFDGKDIEQYSTFILQYYIADKKTSAQETTITINYGGDSTQETVTPNELNTWKHIFNSYGGYDLSIEYGGTIFEVGQLTVKAYDGDLPTISTNAIELNFSPEKKSNSQTNKDSWENEGDASVTINPTFEGFLWGDENGWMLDEDTNEKYLKLTSGAKVTFKDYDFFKTDPFKSGSTANNDGMTIEVDFKMSGILDYEEPLIDCLSWNGATVAAGFRITGQRAEFNTNNYNPTSSQTSDGDTSNGKDDTASPQEMALSSLTQLFSEDERIHLTYVLSPRVDNRTYVETYVNGVLSGIMNVDSDDNLKSAANRPAILTLDSTYGDLFIYGIRVYRTHLSSRTIINNHIASIPSITDRAIAYKENTISDGNGKISYSAIAQIADYAGVPYVLLNGGNQIEKSNNTSVTIGDQRLPYSKKDYRLMSLKMYESGSHSVPTIDVPIELADTQSDEVVTSFSAIKDNTSYARKRGVMVYGQGTSSMVYPVKNLRLKFIAEEDCPVIYNGGYPTEIVCFKADYMDSSSAHNTGTGNLVRTLLTSKNLKTPPMQFQESYLKANKEGKVADKNLLTAIVGFPIIVFFAEGDDTSSYEFVGRYNFNVDKATPEPFGFFPQKIYTGETVTDSQGRIRKVVDVCGLETETVNGKTVLPVDQDGDEIETDIIECWEFLNNDAQTPSKFLTPTASSSIDAALRDNWYTWFEDRYPDYFNGKKDSKNDTLTEQDNDLLESGLFRVVKWVNSTATQYGSNMAPQWTDKALDSPVYYKTLDTSWNSTKQYYNENHQLQDIQAEVVVITSVQGYTVDLDTFLAAKGLNKEEIQEDLEFSFTYTVTKEASYWFDGKQSYSTDELKATFGIGIASNVILQNNDSFTVTIKLEPDNWKTGLYERHEYDNEAYRLAKFKNEFEDYFDLDFCLFYYILTLSLVMMDSRAKNMMIASWDRKIWYPIFYDMDTMLGVNNTGLNKFNYDVEDDPDDKVFNGYDSVLWNNFKACFSSEIAKAYSEYRNGRFSLSTLLSAYNTDQADKWNETMMTEDAVYKYKRPWQDGYKDGSGEEVKDIQPYTNNYLYAAQGRRSLHRQWWLSNRLNYLDSKYLPTSYGSANKPDTSSTISFRMYALPEQSQTEAAAACIAAVPPKHKFNLTALSNSYASIMLGTTIYGPVYLTAGEQVELGATDARHEVESWILNPQLFSDLGDLSDKYLGSFKLPADTNLDCRIKELKLGQSSRSHPDTYSAYYNNLLTELSIPDSFKYLQKINVARCTGLPTLDISNCTRLQELDAEGSNLTGVIFPENSVLKHLYLPSSLKSLSLIGQPHLETIKFDNDTANITKLRVEDVDFDTYPLAKMITTERPANSTTEFYFKNINWRIDSLESADTIDSGKLTGLGVLDCLLDSDISNPIDGERKASLSGTLIIAIPNVTIDEYEIYDKYKRAFPNLDIVFDTSASGMEVNSAYTLTFYNDNPDDEDSTVFYSVKAPQSPTEEQHLGYLVSAEGPNGEELGTPAKTSTEQNSFKFTGYWIDKKTGKKYFADGIESPVSGSTCFDDVLASADMVFYPEYEVTNRVYYITFYGVDGKELEKTAVEWGKAYVEAAGAGQRNYLYREDETKLAEDERYEFYGWTTIKYDNALVSESKIKTVSTVDVDNLMVEKGMTLYPCFVQHRVYDEPLSPYYQSYFQISDSTNISLIAGYSEKITGKFTISDIILNKNNVPDGAGTIKGLSTGITHLYFVTGSKKYFQMVQSFNGKNNNIVVCELPESINTIAENAFSQCQALTTINLENVTYFDDNAFYKCPSLEIELNTETLNPNVSYFGRMAFYNCSKVTVTSLPKNITKIETFAFCGTRIYLNEFGSPDGPDLSLNGIAVFSPGEEYIPANGTVTLHKNITNIASNAFCIGSNKGSMFKDFSYTLHIYMAEGKEISADYYGASLDAIGLGNATTIVWHYPNGNTETQEG